MICFIKIYVPHMWSLYFAFVGGVIPWTAFARVWNPGLCGWRFNPSVAGN